MNATPQNVPIKVQNMDLYIGNTGGGIALYPTHLDNQKGHWDRSHSAAKALRKYRSRQNRTGRARETRERIKRGTDLRNDADVCISDGRGVGVQYVVSPHSVLEYIFFKATRILVCPASGLFVIQSMSRLCIRLLMSEFSFIKTQIDE